MTALALTDHGNMFGAIEFHAAALKEGIKPIIGYEAYLAPGSRLEKKALGQGGAYHLTLLAKNEAGYHNLLKLATAAYLEGFYYKPRIDKEILRTCREGLIILSGCMTSEINSLLAADDYEAAKRCTQEFLEIAQPGCFYVELQDHGIEEQKKTLKGKVRLSEELKIPLVATNDVHYITKGDAAVQEVLLCIKTGKSLQDETRMTMKSDEFYFKTGDEMRARFAQFPDAIANTAKVASECAVEIEFGHRRLPAFKQDSGKSNVEFFRHLCEEGCRARYPNFETDAAVRERLSYEIRVIMETGFVNYFLIVWDFIRFARKRGIPVGPGRGSAAGSIVAYCLGITDIDPLKHGLLFERFLNKDRISMPDIDIDFATAGREEVIDYVAQRYGAENVAQIITFSTLAARGAVRDVGRVLNIPLPDVDAIAKKIPQGTRLKEAIKSDPDLHTFYSQDPTYKKLFDFSLKIEGLCRNASTHAAGVVIADAPLVHYVPLYKDGDQITTQYPMESLEAIGLMKMDFLGLITLDVIEETLRSIRESGIDFPDIRKIPLDDKKTYRLLARGETIGLFQLESSGMRDLLVRIRPDCFDDLVAIIALYRPGVLGSGMIDKYVRRKRGEEPVEYSHPLLKNILRETYGVIVYQEQVMQIANVLGTFSMNEADFLRKAMGKKLPEIMAPFRDKFVEGACKNGVQKETAEEIFDQMEQFGGYGFNKSHSAAYAILSYTTAYLKTNHPLHFMAALLTSEMGKDHAKVAEYVSECEALKIKVLPPDTNRSFTKFAAEGPQIRYGLGGVKNVGLRAAQSIEEVRRTGGEFKSFFDFFERADLRLCNKQAVESLIKCGAFDWTGAKRSQLAAIVDDALRFGATKQADRRAGQKDLFRALEKGSPQKMEIFPEIQEWHEQQLLSYEKEMLGFYLSSHPLAKYEKVVRGYSTSTTRSLSSLEQSERVVVGGLLTSVAKKTTKQGKPFYSVTLEDMEGQAECVLFNNIEEASALLKVDHIVFVRGVVNVTRERPSIRITEVIPLREAHKVLATNLLIFLPEASAAKEEMEKLREILTKHPGESPAYLILKEKAGSATRIKLPDECQVTVSEKLIAAVEKLFPAAQVRYSAVPDSQEF
jgi:DNA polymerase-3 subunit alpha